MKEIVIKYRNGKYVFTSMSKAFNFSASQASQLLEQIQNEMRKGFGLYTWTLEGNTSIGYKVVARYGKAFYRVADNFESISEGKFTESHGKTPKQALLQCNAVRSTLESLNLL